MVFDKEKLLSVFDTTTKAGTDPVRTQAGRLSVASEAPPGQ
jgi:NADH-quinone oxidoreductase subunit I